MLPCLESVKFLEHPTPRFRWTGYQVTSISQENIKRFIVVIIYGKQLHVIA